MPLHYREFDDESHIWRIDAENDFRPSKRQRRALTESFDEYGIDCDGIASISDWRASSLQRSFEEEDMDASSSLDSSSDTMAMEESCDKDHKSVENVLHHYFRAYSDNGFLKEGLDKLLELIGTKNKDLAAKQRYRAEMLDCGGHWMITNLLAACTRENGHVADASTGSMNDDDVGSAQDTYDEMVVAVVVRSCQVLGELLLTDPSDAPQAVFAERTIDNIDTIVRYQIYCAGGLDAVISSLKRFPTSFEVQLAGCQFLSRLVSFKESDDNKETKGGARGVSSSPTIMTLIKNLYQSTEKLSLIVRLVGGGGGTSSSNQLFHSSTQMWQLLFVVAAIIRSVVRQSTLDSSCRSEVIQTVEKYLGCDDGNNHHAQDDTMMIDELHTSGYEGNFGGSSGVSRGHFRRSSIAIKNTNHHSNGIEKYMHEYLMKILVDEEDCYEIDFSSTYMVE